MPRISGLPSFSICPGFAVLRGTGPREAGGAAAHNGSAIGRAIELWHRLGESVEAVAEALDQCRHESAEKFPSYDEAQVRKWMDAYAGDPRNHTDVCAEAGRRDVWHAGVVADWQEREVKLTLDPAEDDPTGRPIQLVGHVDQVRRTPHGGLRVWDVKSSQAGGAQLVYEHAWQLAAYALGATQTWGEGDVLPGGILRLRGYHTREKHAPGEAPAFFPAPWSLDQCREILSTLVAHISLIRQGITLCNPGRYCSFCPGVDPSTCGDYLAQIPEEKFLEFADGVDS